MGNPLGVKGWKSSLGDDDNNKHNNNGFTSAPISRLVFVHYEYQFSFILKLELITLTKILRLDSLWRRDWGELDDDDDDISLLVSPN